MIARSMRWAFGIATFVALVNFQTAASACDQCNGGGGGMRGRSYSSFSAGDYGSGYVQNSGYGQDNGYALNGGCTSCGSSRCRDGSCYNQPKGCRNCPPNPDKVDCCNGCNGGRKRVFGCGWRTWDWLGYWSCGGSCADGVGCGEIYRGDYASDPPACCDPCDGYGNFIGPGSGYRARYNPSDYVGGTPYDYSSDYSYSGGQSYETYREPARMGSAVRSAAPSRLVPSAARKPSPTIERQAWQSSPRTMQR
jgi:hypothetical protein